MIEEDMMPREIHASWATDLAKQQPLGKDFEKVLYDNLWDLYVRSSRASDNAVFWARHEMIARAHRREVSLKILCIAALSLGSWAILWFCLGSLATVAPRVMELILNV